MHELEVPLPHAGLQIDARRAFRRRDCCRDGGRRSRSDVGDLNRQVDEPELFVDGDLRPHAGVAVDGPGVVLPRLVCRTRPGRGMVLNRQSCLPVRTSKARTRPFVLLCVATVVPSRNDDPTMTMSPTTVGVECKPISPVSRSICWPLPLHDTDFQVDDALVAKRADRRTRLRVERDEPIARRDVQNAFVALPSVQYETPRPDNCRGALAARCPHAGCGPSSARRSCRRARSRIAVCRPSYTTCP